MAGPGSRLHRVGTVFSRVQGLLRSGALKETEKPLWYEVYAAFPPRHSPKSNKTTGSVEPVNIMYMEDFIRAKFYNTYGNPQPIDMTREQEPSICQRLIQKYWELETEGNVDKSQLFEAAAEALKAEGFSLKTFDEIEREKQEQMQSRLRQQETTTSSLNIDHLTFSEPTNIEDVIEPEDTDNTR